MTSPIRPSSAQILKQAGVTALLVTDFKNILYLTGMRVSAGTILVSSRGIELYLDDRYLEVARARRFPGVTVRPINECKGSIRSLRKIGIESEQMTVATLRRLKRKFKNTKFVQTSDVIEEFRRSKHLDELCSIRSACRITKAVLRSIPAMLKPPVTERELAARIEAEARRLRADGMAFESIVAFGSNTASPHHHPTDRRLKKGDIVQIDMGAKVAGYCSDYSRVFFLGEKTVEQSKALRALKKAKKVAEELLRAGVTNHALDASARSVLKSFGFGREFPHALGHGVGLEIHEGVTLSSKARLKKLMRHEVVTLEPGLYFEGKWGMRMEETYIVR